MTDTNSVVLIGRITRDINLNDQNDFCVLSNGSARMNFSIAVGKSYTRNNQKVDETSFFNCVIFGKLADAIKQYMLKGTQVCVMGSLKQERWQDKNNGQNRERIVIEVENLQLLGRPQNQQGQTQPQQQGYSQPMQPMQQQGFAPHQQAQAFPQQNGFTQPAYEDIPWN